MNNNKNPWLWVPTLYFAEGLPYFLVNNISVIMFKNMGMSNGDLALYTSLLYLPWVIKPLWSPFVDVLKTKRWWIVTMQILMAAAFFLLALTLPKPSAQQIAGGNVGVSPFIVTLVIFYITALASATHDIAADGYYMIALDNHTQSVFVGIRSTFYRIASVFGQGVLVVIAGLLEKKTTGTGTAAVDTYYDTDAAAYDVGVGYIRVRRKNGVTKYQALWVYDTLFSITSENAQTKGEQIEWQTPTATGRCKALNVDNSGKLKFRKRQLFDTEAAAASYLNGLAGIT